MSGTKPLEGDVIWIKYGSYRFWPGEILPSAAIPDRLVNSTPSREGMFAVRFFGTGELAWLGHENIIPWSNNDQRSRFAGNASKESFKLALQEGFEAFEERKLVRQEKIAAIRTKLVQKAPKFKYLRRNEYTLMPKPQRVGVEPCGCDKDSAPCDENCLNRMMLMECDPKTCPCGSECHNQRFQKRAYPQLVPFKTDARGWGLALGEDVKAGDFIIEYVGEVVGADECRKRIVECEKAGTPSFYILSLGSNTFVDARNRANNARFINHSCAPNCETQKWNVLGETRVGIFVS
jgi:hypothetical protein